MAMMNGGDRPPPPNHRPTANLTSFLGREVGGGGTFSPRAADGVSSISVTPPALSHISKPPPVTCHQGRDTDNRSEIAVTALTSRVRKQRPIMGVLLRSSEEGEKEEECRGKEATPGPFFTAVINYSSGHQRTAGCRRPAPFRPTAAEKTADQLASTETSAVEEVLRWRPWCCPRRRINPSVCRTLRSLLSWTPL